LTIDQAVSTIPSDCPGATSFCLRLELNTQQLQAILDLSTIAATVLGAILALAGGSITSAVQDPRRSKAAARSIFAELQWNTALAYTRAQR
jgi:hypothetical protein